MHSTAQTFGNQKNKAVRVNVVSTCHCQAPMIPAKALEEAVLERVIKIGVNVGDRQKIVNMDLRKIDDEGKILASQIDISRHRLTQVQVEIQNLLEILKHMGKSGISSVGGVHIGVCTTAS